MKTRLPRSLSASFPAAGFVTALAVALASCSDSSRQANAQEASLASDYPAASACALPGVPPSTAVPVASPVSALASKATSAPAASDVTTDAEWRDVADIGFDDRADAFAGIARLNTRLERQIAALNTRRSEITSTDDPGKWDAAMQVLATARTRWISTGTDLSKATPDNWGQLRDRVGAAWTNVQEAVEKAEGEAPR